MPHREPPTSPPSRRSPRIDDGSESILRRLFSRTTPGIKFGLDKTREACSRLGNPQDACPSLHVAGTNGKGSTCAFLDSMLRSAGLRVGVFTSPHLVRFEERFLVDGRPIGPEQWIAVYRDIEKTIDELRLTFFEASTVMAFEVFRRARVDWAVYEVGMGGRLDSTNVITPRVCVIAAIGMDHREFLGDDLVSIAGEKLGIVKKNVPLVMHLPADAAVRDLAVRRCAESGAPCHFVHEGDAVPGDGGCSFGYRGQRFDVPLAGEYQVRNALGAIRAMELAGFGDLSLLAQGIGRTFIPARFQVVAVNGRAVVFDAAHNPQAVEALCAALGERFPGQSLTVVTGIMKDKETAEIVRILSGVAASMIFARPGTERAEDPQVLAARLPAGWKGRMRVVPSVATAVRDALTEEAGAVLVTGSFYTVGEAMGELGVEPYSTPA